MTSAGVSIERIKKACKNGRWMLTQHARLQAGRRMILDSELVKILSEGSILESYPNDPRGPSALVLGHVAANRPIHVVCAFDAAGTLLVITAYEPALPRWLDARTRFKTGERE